MSKISSISLDDTLSLIQLMRETALARGRETQANRLAPVVSEVRNLVNTSRQTAAASGAAPAQNAAKLAQAQPIGGMLAQDDFRTLLKTVQPAGNVENGNVNTVSSAMERNRMVSAMSAANMSDVDIARQLGMTRDEVRMVLSINQKK